MKKWGGGNLASSLGLPVLISCWGRAATLCVVLSLINFGFVSAQEQPVSVTLNARARLFEQLAKDAAAFDQRNILKQVVRLSKPSVVHIQTRKLVDENSRRTVEEAGSGFAIEIGVKKYILTNRHVVFPAVLDGVKISVEDGRMLTPIKIVSDPSSDVALITVKESHLLIPARVGNSSKMEIGDFVVAIGSPFGLSYSITYGIVSAKGRRDLKLGTDGVMIQDFMQTDASINPGNSGGPLVNLRGEVIGINTAIASSSGGSEGIGFTIPVNMAMVIARRLESGGTIAKAYLGIRMDHNFTDATAVKLGLSHARGVRVTGITDGSPANRAGLQTDDVLLSYSGTMIEDDDHLANLVSLTPIGREVSLLLLRNSKPYKVNVKAATRISGE